METQTIGAVPTVFDGALWRDDLRQIDALKVLRSHRLDYMHFAVALSWALGEESLDDLLEFVTQFDSPLPGALPKLYEAFDLAGCNLAGYSLFVMEPLIRRCVRLGVFEGLLDRNDLIHRLRKVLPDEFNDFHEFLGALDSDPVLCSIENATEDDEELTEEDIAALAEAEEDIRHGRVITHDELLRRMREWE